MHCFAMNDIHQSMQFDSHKYYQYLIKSFHNVTGTVKNQYRHIKQLINSIKCVLQSWDTQ